VLENRVREYRERLGISQVELSRRVKVASTNLSSIERGQLAAWPKVKKKLAHALKTPMGELFPEEHVDGKNRD
jgi:transcriptional regulator with XRE-family HTH domain